MSTLSKHCLSIEYHVHIWQVSPQLSSNINMIKRILKVVHQIKKFTYGEINERSLSIPHRWPFNGVYFKDRVPVDVIYWYPIFMTLAVTRYVVMTNSVASCDGKVGSMTTLTVIQIMVTVVTCLSWFYMNNFYHVPSSLWYKRHLSIQ